MKLNKSIIILPIISIFVMGCSNQDLTLEERLHNAYLNVIEAKEENFRTLVNLTKEDSRVDWKDNKVLLFTLHRFPSSYPDGEQIIFTWGESWLCSVKECKNWYLENKDNVTDPLLRMKQLLGMSDQSKNTYISSMWLDPIDLKRPAYETDVTKPMKLSFNDNESEEYKTWFMSQYYYSYDVNKLPWTRLGYTYDWSKEAKDKYGLSEFIAFKGTTAIVEKTLLVEDFLSSFLD